ncbi:MAG TPA: helix-turn-helix domain-containing protein [Solirubrobacteraceae bacterium]
MADRRTYGDSCGIARALDRVGERWALLVVRELALGPKRFTDLRGGLPGVAPDILAQRLRDLEAAAVVHRRRLPPPAAARVYELTEWGRELVPVLLALGRWGSRAPLPDRPRALSPDALALALETTFAPTVTPTAASYQLMLGEHAFRVTVDAFGIELTRGHASDPVFTLRTDPSTLSGLLWHGRSIGAARRAGTLELEGDTADLARFLDLFSAPVPVAA